MSSAVASVLGLQSEAGQTLARSIVDRKGQVRQIGRARYFSTMFGAEGAGQVLAAATQSMAQYNAPGPAPQGSAVTSSFAAPPRQTPPDRQQPPPPPALPDVAKEGEGEKEGGMKITTPMVVGGILLLVVVAYFLAK